MSADRVMEMEARIAALRLAIHEAAYSDDPDEVRLEVIKRARDEIAQLTRAIRKFQGR